MIAVDTRELEPSELREITTETLTALSETTARLIKVHDVQDYLSLCYTPKALGDLLPDVPVMHRERALPVFEMRRNTLLGAASRYSVRACLATSVQTPDFEATQAFHAAWNYDPQMGNSAEAISIIRGGLTTWSSLPENAMLTGEYIIGGLHTALANLRQLPRDASWSSNPLPPATDSLPGVFIDVGDRLA